MLLSFAIHAPIKELKVKEIEARNVAADVLEEITDRAMSKLLKSSCTFFRNVYQFMVSR